MVVIDQFRISDNGQLMYVDAHVNKAKCFDNMYIKRMTICTEDQISELDPEKYGDKFIYQELFEPKVNKNKYYPVDKKVTAISAEKLLPYYRETNQYGWLSFEFTPLENATDNAVSLIFSGKYPILDSNFSPVLVIASGNFDPSKSEINSSEVFFTIEGTKLEEQGHAVWQFKGKGSVGDRQVFNVYLYKREEDERYECIDIKNDTEDINFLHFYYRVYSELTAEHKKQIHEVLCAASFNAAFNNLKYNGEGNPYKDETGEWARLHEGPVATQSFDKNGLSSNMFFVFFECEGLVGEDTPCTLDETTMGVTFDYGVIFNGAMGYAKELSDGCSIPKNFIDFILNFNALKLSLETDHYIPAIEYWKRLTKESKNASGINTKSCGCHG